MTTRDIPVIRSVEPLGGFVLRVAFATGEVGELDMSPYLDFGIFDRLKAPGAFEAVRVAFDTVEWECGVDLDPEFVYSKCGLTAV